MSEQRVDQRLVRMSGRRMHDQAGSLVDDDEMLVLEQHLEIHRLWLCPSGGGRALDYLDLVALTQANASFGRLPVDADRASVTQPLELGAC